MNNPPKIWQIIFVGFIAIFFTIIWLRAYEVINKFIWENTFVKENHWTLPILVIFFSLIVGLAQKYLGAPNVIKGGAVDAFKGNEADMEKDIPFFGTLTTSLASLFSGASIGPEGSLGTLVGQISKFIRKKFKISGEAGSGFDAAAMASAYNGIIGSPLFTSVLATELRSNQASLTSFLTWNLLAGAVGFLVFFVTGFSEFAKYIPFTPIETLSAPDIFWAVILGFLGTLIAVSITILFKVTETVFDRFFSDKIVLRTLTAGVLIAIIGFFVPEVMFAGETQIFPMLQNPAAFGVFTLLIFALLKLLLLAVSLKSGFLGGPTFPILFSATMIGLALSLVFPSVPVSIFIMCTEVAVITLLLNAPLTAILLVGLVGTADSNTIVLLVLSSAVAMVLGEALKKRSAKKLPAVSKSNL